MNSQVPTATDLPNPLELSPSDRMAEIIGYRKKAAAEAEGGPALTEADMRRVIVLITAERSSAAARNSARKGATQSAPTVSLDDFTS